MMAQATYRYDTATVQFAIYPHGPESAPVIAEITESALRALFGAKGGPSSLVKAYEDASDAINGVALSHFNAAPERSVVLKISSFLGASAT